MLFNFNTFGGHILKNTLVILILVLCTLFSTLTAQQTTDTESLTDSLTDKGWDAWKEGNYDKAQNLFIAASKTDEEATRGAISMMFLIDTTAGYSENRNNLITGYLDTIKKNADDYKPYLISTNYFHSFSGSKNMANLYKKILKKDNNNEFFNSLLKQNMALYYLGINKFDKAEEYSKKVNTLNAWKMVGPFENSSLSGMKESFEPELEYIAEATYEGSSKLKLNWVNYQPNVHNIWVNFHDLYYQEVGVYYANSFVYAPKEMDVVAGLGFSGAVKLFINDGLVYEEKDERNNGMDSYKIKIKLNEGWNRVLVKIGCDEGDNANFLLRICDESGNTIDGVKTSTELQEYSKGNEGFEILENATIAYFKNKIEQNPTHYENYLCLAISYLNLDEGEEAEKVLESSELIVGESSLWELNKLRSYISAHKYAKISESINKMYSMDKKIYLGQITKMQEKIRQEDVENAKILLAEHESLFGKTPDFYNSSIQYEYLKGDEPALIKVAEEAIEAYPNVVDFISTDVILKMQRKNFSGAVKAAKRILDIQCSANNITYVANIALQTGDSYTWKDYMNHLIDYNSTNIFSYLDYAVKLEELKRYKEAISYVDKARSINPQIERVWSLKAELNSLMSKDELAKENYEMALEKWPLSYDIRNILREMDGKPDLFAEFTEYKPEDNLASEIDSDTYPDDNAVILNKDINMLIFEEGGAESSSIYLYKILNDKGIEEFKIKNLGEDFRYGSTNILEAKIIKEDGTVKNADVNGSQAVFEDLEVNDYIYYKLKTEYYFSGMFMGEFWEEVELNSTFPTKRSHFKLTTPVGKEFQINSTVGDVAQTVYENEENKVYEWEMLDEPAVKNESRMPYFNEISKKISISSIESWADIVTWYDKVTESKHRVDYEVEKLSAELFAGKKELSDYEKIRVVYDYIIEEIEYISVSFRQDGVIPQKASNVIISGMGDCKDVATLAKALLKTVGIEAYYVLLNSSESNPNTTHLPALNVFNHAIAAIDFEDKTIFLDCTAENYAMEVLPYGDRNAPALLIKPGQNALIRLPETVEVDDAVLITTKATLSDSGDLDVSKNFKRTGYFVPSQKRRYRDLSNEMSLKKMKESLESDFSNVTILELNFEDLDAIKSYLDYNYKFIANNYLVSTGSFNILKIPFTYNTVSMSYVSYEERKTPIEIWMWKGARDETIELTLPSTFKLMEVPENVSFDNKFATYSMSFKKVGQKIVVTRNLNVKKDWIEVDEYKEFKEFYNKLVKADAAQLLLKSI